MIMTMLILVKTFGFFLKNMWTRDKWTCDKSTQTQPSWDYVMDYNTYLMNHPILSERCDGENDDIITITENYDEN